MALALALPTFVAAQSTVERSKISHSTRIATLNPLSLSGPAEYPVIDMAYSGLTRIGPDSQPMPDLAKSWEGSPDATEFTFHLHEGVTFHDGTPATSSDVVATYEAILNPDIPSSALSVLNMIDSVEAVDDLTVKFTLSSPFADFPTSTAHANARIISEEALSGDLTKLDTVVNGTGPFKMESYDSARVTRLVRNDNYFSEGKPYLTPSRCTLSGPCCRNYQFSIRRHRCHVAGATGRLRPHFKHFGHKCPSGSIRPLCERGDAFRSAAFR